MSKKSKKRVNIDLDSLDLERVYSIEEFEYISNLIKNRPSFEIDGELVHHFELTDTGKLIPRPPTTVNKEVVVARISSQLEDWNVTTRQKGMVTTSQGGFKVSGDKIVAPDVAFTPRKLIRRLSKKQVTTFQGRPWSPVFVVEVDDFDNITSRSRISKFAQADSKMKDIFFAQNTYIQLGWLIDSVNRNIWVYKRNKYNQPFRRKRSWDDLSGDKFLPGFTLDIDRIVMEELEDAPSESEASSPGSPSSSSTASSVEQYIVQCVYCDDWFESKYLLVKHLKFDHDDVV